MSYIPHHYGSNDFLVSGTVRVLSSALHILLYRFIAIKYISTQQIKLTSRSMQTMLMFACDPCWLSGTLIALYHKCMPIVLQMKHISAVFGFDLWGLPAAVTVSRAAHLTPMPGRWSAWESLQRCAAHLCVTLNPEYLDTCSPFLTPSPLYARL